jgi:hypothetical protein
MRGTPSGGEFRVNAATADNQVGPVVAMDNAGDFAVAWSTRVSAVGGNLVVYAREFNADGTARTGDIQVTAASTSQANFAMSIAMDSGGDFVVLTDGWAKSGKSTNSGIIQFQRYNAQGQAQGKLVQVASTTLVNGSAAVAMDDQPGHPRHHRVCHASVRVISVWDRCRQPRRCRRRSRDRKRPPRKPGFPPRVALFCAVALDRITVPPAT